jgi:hypothetical protein
MEPITQVHICNRIHPITVCIGTQPEAGVRALTSCCDGLPRGEDLWGKLVLWSGDPHHMCLRVVSWPSKSSLKTHGAVDRPDD